MKTKIFVRSLLVFLSLSLVALLFTGLKTADTASISDVCPGFHVTVTGGGTLAAKVTAIKKDNPNQGWTKSCTTGSGEDRFCDVCYPPSAGYYDITASNSLCSGRVNNVYWPGSGSTNVTVPMIDCYK